MKNKHGVKITSVERKYFNSLKQSIRRSSKAITDVLKQYETPSYMKKKSHNYGPVTKRTTVHSFKTREDFLKEIESLTKLKTELAIYKPRKPKYLEELPKRLQKDFEKEVRGYGRTNRVKAPKSLKQQKTKQEPIERLLQRKFIVKRNQTYLDNMVTAIFKTFDEQTAEELISALKSMTESEFMRFFLSRPNETIGFVYYNPNSPSVKHLDLMRDIVNATK